MPEDATTGAIEAGAAEPGGSANALAPEQNFVLYVEEFDLLAKPPEYFDLGEIAVPIP